eukprot:6010822-Prymnesium_polylepis.1
MPRRNCIVYTPCSSYATLRVLKTHASALRGWLLAGARRAPAAGRSCTACAPAAGDGAAAHGRAH